LKCLKRKEYWKEYLEGKRTNKHEAGKKNYVMFFFGNFHQILLDNWGLGWRSG
jgi:hypothetical protein